MANNFAICQGRGFQLTFANGWTVSVQFGPGNYCDPHHRFMSMDDYDAPKRAYRWVAETAEIAAWDSNNRWYKFPHDTVKGYVSSDEVAKFIRKISNRKVKT